MTAYDYSHSSRKRDVIRRESAALYDRMFRLCDAFTLTESIPVSQIRRQNPDFTPDTRLEDALSGYEIRKFSGNSWYGWPGRSVTVHLYPAVSETRHILGEFLPTLFPDSAHRRRLPSLEDLCFLENGVMRLGSLSHELLCTVFTEDTDLIDELNAMGRLTGPVRMEAPPILPKQ